MPRHVRPRLGQRKKLLEIGSITKLFTALLLSDMASRGEVRLDGPAGELLPAPAGTGVRRKGRKHRTDDCA
jgi:CubicO group peptidase (beta-lactamase class C family)